MGKALGPEGRRSTPQPKTRSMVVTVVVLALAAAACSSGGGGSNTAPNQSPATNGTSPLQASDNPNAPKPGGTPANGGTLRFGIATETDGFNPVANQFALSGHFVASALYDPLVRIGDDRKVQPYLAASVTPDDNATVWTIKAKPDVTFHDGTPFDAEAIKVNIEQRTKSVLTSVALEPIESVSVSDPMTAVVKMRRPWVAFDYTLAAQGGYMISPKALLAADGTINPDAANKPVGTGPFEFVSRTRDNNIVVKKYAKYWQEGKPHLDGIEFKIITDSSSRRQSLQSGDLDAMMSDQPDAVAKFRKEPGYVQVEDLAAEEAFVMVNMGKSPFDNVNARRALAYGTDRQAVIDNVGSGLPPDATQPYVPSEQWYVEDHGYPSYDPTKAKEYVDKYKAETGQPTLSFEFTIRSGGNSDGIAQTLQAQWSQVGIDMKIKTIEQTQLVTTAVFGRYEAILFNNFAYVEPDSNYIFWHSSTAKGIDQMSVNMSQTKDPEIDAALDKARSSTDAKERKEAYATVVRRLNQNLPYIWLYHNLWAVMAKDNVHGLDKAQAAGFARLDSKTWWPDVWMTG